MTAQAIPVNKPQYLAGKRHDDPSRRKYRRGLVDSDTDLRRYAAQQFQIKCSAYLVTSVSQPAKSQMEGLPNKVEVPMESAGKVSVSTPVGNRPGVKLRPDNTECHAFVTNGYGPSSVMLLSNTRSGYVEIHGGGRGAVALGVVSYMDYGDAPECQAPGFVEAGLSDAGDRGPGRHRTVLRRKRPHRRKADAQARCLAGLVGQDDLDGRQTPRCMPPICVPPRCGCLTGAAGGCR